MSKIAPANFQITTTNFRVVKPTNRTQILKLILDVEKDRKPHTATNRTRT